MLRVACLLALAAALTAPRPATEPRADAARYALKSDISYRSGPELTDYMRERCRLDLYYPQNEPGFATVVWFHGGGLSAGEREVPAELKQQGIAVVAVNYRLHPKVTAPAYIEDAAAAVAWTFAHIGEFGGDPSRIFVSGHSAGGYLTSMVGLDQRWLAAHDIDANRIAGLIPYSGHAITHFTVRAERGIPGTRPIVDDLAPLYHVRADAPPILLITGDRNRELLGRYEENAYFWRMLREAGHRDCELCELQGFDHGGMARPAHALLLEFVRKHAKQVSAPRD